MRSPELHPSKETPPVAQWYCRIRSAINIAVFQVYTSGGPPKFWGGFRWAVVGDCAVCAAEDQDLHQLLEDHAVGDAGSVAAERMIHFPVGEQGTELLEDVLLTYGWMTGTLLELGKLREL